MHIDAPMGLSLFLIGWQSRESHVEDAILRLGALWLGAVCLS